MADTQEVIDVSKPSLKRVHSALLEGSPKEEQVPRAESTGSLRSLVNTPSPRRSAPGSAKSELSRKKPLPPIGRDGEGDEFASITESELATDRNIEEVNSSENEEPLITKGKVSPILEVKAESSPIENRADEETQTEWSWIETMKIIQRQHTQAAKTAEDEDEHIDRDSQKGSRMSGHSKTSKVSKAGNLMSQVSRRQSSLNMKRDVEEVPESNTFIALSPSGISAGSITGPVNDAPPEVLTTLILPYRDDEYGIPALQFSDSDTDSEQDESLKPTRSLTKTLPSVGPPQILQYQRDKKKGIITDDDDPLNLQGNEPGTAATEGDTGGQELITFSGNCEFCNSPIKPFPTLHQQQICKPEELYCCEEFANFVRLAILPPPPNAHLIDIKPHAHYGSKQARAAAKEKAELRMREREVRKVRQAASSNSGGGTGNQAQGNNAAVTSHHGPSHGGGGGGGQGGGGGGGGANHQPSNQASLGGGGGGGGANMFASESFRSFVECLIESDVVDDFSHLIKLADSNTCIANLKPPDQSTNDSQHQDALVLPTINVVRTSRDSAESKFPSRFTKSAKKGEKSKLFPAISRGMIASSRVKLAASNKARARGESMKEEDSEETVATKDILSSVGLNRRLSSTRKPSLRKSIATYPDDISQDIDWAKYYDARAMKTINFQLSSQKCMDEGYVIRPPSPIRNEEQLAEPFEIEPVEWGHMKRDDEHDDEDDDTFSYVDEDGNYVQFVKPKPKKQCVERYYPSGEKFLTLFPDGTGNVFYENGQVAISVSSVQPGKFTYLVYDTTMDEKRAPTLLAEFEPDAKATCYHKAGNIRLFLDQLGGIELTPSGERKKRWHWLADPDAQHIHAPPVQPLCFALNRHIGVRVVNQDNISMTFLSHQRSCRFNVGVKLKLVHPENLPFNLQFDDDQIFMNEKANKISGLIDKIESLLKFPHSNRADKIPVPKRVTINAERIERQKVQSIEAKIRDKQRRSHKFTRPLRPVDPLEDFDNVLMTEPELSTSHTERQTHRDRGRPPKYPTVSVN